MRIILPFSLILVACSVNEAIDPVSFSSETGKSTSSTIETSSSTTDTTSSESQTTAIKRTVQTRSPFGNVEETANLLWDGDFEWSSALSDQYGWYIGSGWDYEYLTHGYRLGADCKSGIKCAPLAAGNSLIGIGVSSVSSIEASFYAKPSTFTCALYAILIDESFEQAIEITPTSETPDDTGWCTYISESGPLNRRAFLYIENSEDPEVLIDDAVVRKSTANARMRSTVKTARDAATLERLTKVLETLRKPKDSPPTKAARSLEKWMSK